MELKFFKKDVIGKLPKKVGDVFVARVLGGQAKFKVVEFYDVCIFAVRA